MLFPGFQELRRWRKLPSSCYDEGFMFHDSMVSNFDTESKGRTKEGTVTRASMFDL